MNVTNQLAKLKVKEVFNDSTKRPFLFVYPDKKLLEITTFLAIGPEIYVDGVVVVTEESRNGKKNTDTCWYDWRQERIAVHARE